MDKLDALDILTARMKQTHGLVATLRQAFSTAPEDAIPSGALHDGLWAIEELLDQAAAALGDFTKAEA